MATINLGLRYEATTVPTEAHGKLTNLPSLTSATPHLGDPFFSNPTKLDFEPTVGVSWDPFSKGKTSVRGGFGIFDNLPLPYLFELTTILSAPFFELGNIASPNLPPGSFPRGAFPLLTTPTLRYAYIQPNPPRSYVMQWNVNVQQEVAKDMVLLVGYTGSQWGGILHLATGEPFTPTVSPDPLGMSGANAFDRPDVVLGLGCSGSRVNPGNPLHYIRTQCFAFRRRRRAWAMLDVIFLTGPGILNLDSSLFSLGISGTWRSFTHNSGWSSSTF